MPANGMESLLFFKIEPINSAKIKLVIKNIIKFIVEKFKQKIIHRMTSALPRLCLKMLNEFIFSLVKPMTTIIIIEINRMLHRMYCNFTGMRNAFIRKMINTEIKLKSLTSFDLKSSKAINDKRAMEISSRKNIFNLLLLQ